MKFYAVIDTNVIVAALLSRKKDVATVKVLKAVQEGLILPLVHQQIIDEYKEVLCRPKFHLPRHLIDSITEQLRAIGIFLDRTPSNENFPDPKDVVFYEVALSKKDSFLVTGNIKHFPSNPIVVTPAEMMRLIEESK